MNAASHRQILLGLDPRIGKRNSCVENYAGRRRKPAEQQRVDFRSSATKLLHLQVIAERHNIAAYKLTAPRELPDTEGARSSTVTRQPALRSACAADSPPIDPPITRA